MDIRKIVLESEILKKKNVIGFSLSLKPRIRNGQIVPKTQCIRIYVKEKVEPKSLIIKDLIPRVLGDIETDVVEVGEVKALADKTSKIRPVPLGVSVGNFNITAGSLGMLYTDSSGNILAGSNAHVLTESPEKPPEEQVEKRILQPGCYSEDTEVLTEDGWKKFYELNQNDKVATLKRETGEIEFQVPTKFWKYFYKGKMIHWQGQMYDLLVTPEHNVFCKIYSKRTGKKTTFKHQWKLLLAKDIINYEIEFSKTGIWNCKDKNYFKITSLPGRPKHVGKVPIDIWLKFMGWYLAEGCLGKKDYRILITQKQKKNLNEIKEIIKQLGFSPSYNSSSCQFMFCSKELWNYLKQFGLSGNKFVPKEIKELPSFRLRTFLEAYFKGDGTFKNKQLRRCSSKSKKLLDDIMELLIKCGLSGKLSKKNNIWVLSVNSHNLTPLTTKFPQIKDYEGFVYDITVPNHILMIRRNGSPLWSGNSYHGGQNTENIVGTYFWHKRVVPLGESNCNIGKGLASVLNFFLRLLKRNGRFKYTAEFENKIDFAVYLPSVEHTLEVADGSLGDELFIGHLFAGSDNTGIICKVKYILQEGYTPLIPHTEVKTGDTVKGCSFWCNYETTVSDDSAVIQVSYGNFTAIFSDVIIVNNNGTIKGGWSGSGWRLIKSV